MIDRNTIAAKLAELDKRVRRVEATRRDSGDAYASDETAAEIVAFNLMLAVQSCSDLVSHLIADEGWPAAASQAAGFNRLRDQGVISAGTAAALCRAVGLRNVVAHGYGGINPAMVFAAATRGTADLEVFAREVAGWVEQRASR